MADPVTVATDRPDGPGAGVHVVDPRDDPLWDALTASTSGTLFTSPPWLRAVCDTYGFVPRAAVVAAPGGPVGGLAVVEVRDLRGTRVLSLPFSDRADPVLRSASAWDRLVPELTASHAPFTLRCLDGTPPACDPRLRVAHRAAWHGTPLTAAPDELFTRLHPSARRNVRAASRSGLEVVPSTGVEAVRTFHRLHVALRKRKYRLLPQPAAFFERIWREFSDRDGVVTMLARVDGRPVAGALFLVWQDVLYYKFGASLATHLRVRPNDALFWEAIRWASARGLRLVDWGLSELDQAGLVGFKRKWATAERRIVTLRGGLEHGGETDEFTELLAALTRLLTRDDVPDHLSAHAGALLYRYFC